MVRFGANRSTRSRAEVACTLHLVQCHRALVADAPSDMAGTPPPPPAQRLLASALVLALAIGNLACESQSSTSTGPSPVKCQVSLEAPSDSIAPGGGKGAVAVLAPPECSWTASSGAPWITGLTPSSGQGSGRVEFEAGDNPAGTMRQGYIEVNNQQATVQQQPAPCRFQVSPLAPTVAAAGGTVTLTVTTLAGCPWQASSGAGWVTVANTSGTGSGTLNLRVAAGAEARSAAIVVAGQTVTLTQQPATPPSPSTCGVSLGRATETVSAAGGSITVGVSGPSGCPWTSASGAGWITVVAGASGDGAGAVSLSVAPNSGAARTGLVTIAGVTFTVFQSAAAGAPSTACAYSVAPTTQSIGAGGGAGTAIAVSTTAGCMWTATNNAEWITLLSGGGGSGPGTVTFSVAANSGAARSGSLTIAGATATIDQAAGSAPSSCTYSLNSTEKEVGEKGDSFNVTVSTASGCSWTATSHDSWIVITEGAAGSGRGPVRIDVARNDGPARTGTLTIAGQTFTVSQKKAKKD
jgi:hypothetical protein